MKQHEVNIMAIIAATDIVAWPLVTASSSTCQLHVLMQICTPFLHHNGS